VRADDRVGFRSDELEASARRHGDRGDDAASPARPRPADGGGHRRACREAVVDEQDRLSGEVERLVDGVQAVVELGRLSTRACDRCSAFVLGEVAVAEHKRRLVRRDGADRDLRVPRVADLAHCHDVERCAQRERDFGGNRDAAARESDDDRVPAALVRERSRQLTPGLAAVVVERRHPQEEVLDHDGTWRRRG
jgi:hypothetical protein